MLSYLRDRFATISRDSWHYRLTRYGLGKLTDHVKRACPYWLFLVPLASFTGFVRWTTTALYYVVLYLGYYPWMALIWTLGYKPRYWRGLTSSVLDGGESILLKKSRYGGDCWHWYVPLLMAPVLTMTPIIIWVYDIGHRQADVVTALFWPYQALIAYAGLLAIIALGNGWKRGLWPLVYKAYCAVCPELKVVESAPSRSRTEPAR